MAEHRGKQKLQRFFVGALTLLPMVQLVKPLHDGIRYVEQQVEAGKMHRPQQPSGPTGLRLQKADLRGFSCAGQLFMEDKISLAQRGNCHRILRKAQMCGSCHNCRAPICFRDATE